MHQPFLEESMKAKNVLFYFFISQLISMSLTQAQWVQTNGPYGGNVTALAVSGTNLFAGTDGGAASFYQPTTAQAGLR